MEVLGAAAAADQLLKEAFKLVQLIRTIRDKYQGAPKEIEAWRQEIEDFAALIKHIETLPALDGYEIDVTIENCRAICHKLIDIFSGLDFAANDARLHKTWMAIKGIDQEPVVKKHFEELQRLKGTLSMKINVSQVTRVYQTAQDVQFIKELIQPGTEEDRCLRSLFITNPPDHRDAIITAKGVRVDGTCEWITSTDEYKAWVTTSPGLLWLSGGPGKGKTFISIFLTKHLSESANVIYFFCDNKDASRNTAVAILRGLLYQLINQYPRLLHHVFTPWKVQQNALFNSNSFESLWRIFQTMLEELGADLICVLDGLDECADDSLTGLLHKIKMLFTESLERHKLRLIILSRRHPDCLERMLGSFARIDLDSDQASNESDINSYITSRVAQLAERKGISASLVGHIEETFREKSEDTFLWVSFMADDLEKQTVSGIEKALQALPRGLDEIYERILLNIKPDNAAIVATMLQWVALAMYPLSVPALAEAIQCEASGYLSKEKLCLSYIESCGHLLQISGVSDADESFQDSEVTFVHQSIKDFLFGQAKRRTISAFQVDKAQGDILLERYHYNIEVVGAWGQTPLCDAIRSNNNILARRFVTQWGASIGAPGEILKAVANSPDFHMDRKIEGIEGLEFVISEWNIDINARDECGDTILHHIFKKEKALHRLVPQIFYEFVARCLVLGADPSLRSTNGDAPFHLYKWVGRRNILTLRPIILLLRDGRLGVNDQGNGGNTLLHNFIRDVFEGFKVAKNSTLHGLTSLLDVGADRTLVDSNGMAALQLAKKLCDSSTHGERIFNVETLAGIVDVLENYATVSNQPQRLDPLDWPAK